MYKIIEVHIVVGTEVGETIIAVLWEANELGSVRATYCTDTPCSGYKFLLPNEKLSYNLLQEVAAAGMNLSDDLKEKYFGKRFWDR